MAGPATPVTGACIDYVSSLPASSSLFWLPRGTYIQHARITCVWIQHLNLCICQVQLYPYTHIRHQFQQNIYHGVVNSLFLVSNVSSNCLVLVGDCSIESWGWKDTLCFIGNYVFYWGISKFKLEDPWKQWKLQYIFVPGGLISGGSRCS